jgi:hypothetical protein
MSGGFFDYKQYEINNIIDSIERELNKQGQLKPKDEIYGNDEYLKKYPEEKFYHTYPEEIQEKMKEAIKTLKIAAVYVQRIDWFISGDDGEETFLTRLSEDLNKIDNA